MSSTTSILDTLMGPAARAAFLLDYWPRHAFHTWVSPESWPTFLRSELWSKPELLDQGYRGPIDVTRGNGGQYSASGLPLGGSVRDLGLVARLPDVAALFPEAQDWLVACRKELGIPTGQASLSAFLNPPNLGLGPHCDPGDHLLFHVYGEKQFRWFDNPSGQFVSASHAVGFPAKARDAAVFKAGFPTWQSLPAEAAEVTLRPGSVLFIPRGTYHETKAGPDGISVSVVMSVNLPSRSDLLSSYLRDYLNQDPRWREPMPEGRADLDLPNLLEELARGLTQLDARRVLEHRSEFATKQELTPDDRFLRDPAVGVATSGEADGKRIELKSSHKPTRSLKLGAAATQVVEYIAAQARPFSFGDLCREFEQWEADSLGTLVRTLVRERALLPITPEPWRVTAGM
jgi:Cupin superfamily protein